MSQEEHIIHSSWEPDDSQKKVICIQGDYHLVLAPPGCGKTQILTERIRYAHLQGVEYEDMLCLTFTNRAARGMTERIGNLMGIEDIDRVYVGNVHRFCSKFLFDNEIVAAGTSVIDEEDAISIIARALDEDELAIANNQRRKKEYAEIVHLSHFMFQIAQGHDKELRLHPECINKDDIAAMKKICDVQQLDFSAKTMCDIYINNDIYHELAQNDGYDYASRIIIERLLRKMRYARTYEEYKNSNHLIDFEDLLILTYEEIKDNRKAEYHLYKWIQVDEVQDLNRLQLAIIDGFTDKKKMHTVMYLGDEQQAIFSFMGAKIETLDQLKQRCQGNIHHLNINHRSPKYLLDALNDYAANILGISKELLPVSQSTVKPSGEELKILRSSTLESEYHDVTDFAIDLYQKYEKQTTAIIVNANSDADIISERLKDKNVPHFKVSGTDVFSSPVVKFMLAHLNILACEHNFISWARILKGTGCVATNASARLLTRELMDRAMTPLDLLYSDGKTYIQQFIDSYGQEEFVIFDTETTGLNVWHDDIIQIAAVKIRKGKAVAGSQICINIETDKEIPMKLGDIDNPIIAARQQAKLYTRAEGLKMFMDYSLGCTLLAHNAEFDYRILNFNLRRDLPDISLKNLHPKYFDSLKLARLLETSMMSYTLKNLLKELSLEGKNTHLADDDVHATTQLAAYCYENALKISSSQQEFLQRKQVRLYAEKFNKNYKQAFLSGKRRLYEVPDNKELIPIIDELKIIYEQAVDKGMLSKIDKIDYILNYIQHDIIREDAQMPLQAQLANCLSTLNTLKEADLCGSKVINDRIFVTTIHKAKGLEFDNVIVFDAVDGRFPNYYSRFDAQATAEDARKFYVALSRAKQRLYIAQSTIRIDYHNQTHPREITPFMRPILKHFS